MPERRNGCREFEYFAKSGRKKLDRNWGKREGCIGVMLWGLEEQVDLWLSRVLAGRHSRPAAQYAPAHHPPDTERRAMLLLLLLLMPAIQHISQILAAIQHVRRKFAFLDSSHCIISTIIGQPTSDRLIGQNLLMPLNKC